MANDCSALELRARLALLAAPDGVLSEGALAKAIGRTTRAGRDALVAKLAAEAIVSVEPARRGRRLRLVDPRRVLTSELRVPARARLSGAVVNALLARVTMAGSVTPPASAPLRERVLRAHERLARGPARTAELVALRAELADVAAPELDRELIALDRDGVLPLGRAVDLAALGDDARRAAIDDPYRGLLVYVSRTEARATEATS